MKSQGRDRVAYHCTECGAKAARWIGRCPECQAWGTVTEDGRSAPAPLRAGPVSGAAVPIAQVDAGAAAARPTGIDELDRVLGGGLVRGAVVLLAGEPGVGKSTLLLDLAHRWCSTDRRCGGRASAAPPGGGRALVATGEESAAQVRLRAERTGSLADDLYLAAETDLGALISHVDHVRPSLLIVDSIQTIASGDIDGVAGGVTQVRAVAAALISLAKARGIATIIVGHVTKDGSVAGPRLLEHLVDVVLQFDGDRHSALRMIRAVKNRYGPADEIGCFELVDTGIVGVTDPSGLFLSHRSDPVAGTCTSVVLEGRRPLVAEIQALAVPIAGGSPRRVVTGLESARFAMLAAIVGRHGGGPAFSSDLYGSTVGGVRIAETASDLAVVISLASAIRQRPVPTTMVAFGEVGLAGDVRRVSGIGRRLAEAARLGFRTAVVPAGQGVDAPHNLAVQEVRDVASLLRRLGIDSGRVADLAARSRRRPGTSLQAVGSGRPPMRPRGGTPRWSG